MGHKVDKSNLVYVKMTNNPDAEAEKHENSKT